MGDVNASKLIVLNSGLCCITCMKFNELNTVNGEPVNRLYAEDANLRTQPGRV